MTNNNYGGSSIGIVGLIVLFWNFDSNTFDLYDMIVKALGAG